MGIGALWAAAAALCALAGRALVTAESKGDHEFGGDDESDSAPFMVVLQHGDAHSCGGSLVSPRTVLTSAWCARGGEPGAALWAQAPAAPTARRRVVRVAQALGEPLRAGWLGAAGDIALLELERPFDADAGSRPILTAGAPDDCGAGAVCHVVRARGRPPRLRILDATRAPADDTCDAVASGWPALRDSALCLSGPTLCSTDRGAGVVCDGQLCGVLSRSARSAAWRGAAPDEDASCGDVHVALSVARWRRFLHCAHILRACGRGDGECAHQCTERQLIASSETIFSRTDGLRGGAPSGDAAAGGDLPRLRAQTSADVAVGAVPNDTVLRNSLTKDPTRTTLQQYENLSTTWQPVSRSPTTARSGTAPESRSSASRPSFEFEPNRADFKAGEYGDNAADYGAVEEVAAGPRDGGDERAPSTSAVPTLTGQADAARTWRADPAPTARAAEPTSRALANQTRPGAPEPEDMPRAAAPQPRAAAVSVRTRSLVTFVFATITLLVTN